MKSNYIHTTKTETETEYISHIQRLYHNTCISPKQPYLLHILARMQSE
jgi:hypothetical protein